MRELLDIAYRTVGETTLYLDLFLPDEAKSPPLIFWIHGGAWRFGDRKWCALKNQAERGYAVASVDYRLSTTAPFPACIEDCKYALAFLRQNADKYAIDTSRVCAAGDSAGGHLAALMGVSAGHEDWEPKGADCSVQAVIDICGSSSLKRDYQQTPEQDNSIINDLLGAPINSPKGMMLAAAANPITYADGTEPPFLIMHGDKDDTVLIEQSYMLRNELESYGNSVAMHTVFGGGHSFDYNNPVNAAVINGFLDLYIMK
ncbi:MAG: alpha/beta hydrolase [Oscillospiraceae bacterium]|nr:alpha/beta hydrolase [Oscillospiraceae bacterium]